MKRLTIPSREVDSETADNCLRLVARCAAKFIRAGGGPIGAGRSSENYGKRYKGAERVRIAQLVRDMGANYAAKEVGCAKSTAQRISDEILSK